MNTGVAGRYIPANSVVHTLDARIKLVSFFLMLAATICTSSVRGYLFIFCLTAAVVTLSKIPVATALAPVLRLRLFFLIIFLMNALFYGAAEPLWSWGIISLSREGIIQGTRVVLNVLFIMVWAAVVTGATTLPDMTGALGTVLKPLKLIRVPVDDVAMIISVAVQFIPTLQEEADMIKKAQTARGARFESKKLKEKALSFLPLFIPVFLSAFRRAEELSLAMEARGYRNAKDRTRKAKKPLNCRDVSALAGWSILCFVHIYVIG